MKNLFLFMAILSLFACNDTSEKKSSRRKSKIQTTTTEQSPEEYYGNWEGTYDGDEQGTWEATCDSNGCVGYAGPIGYEPRKANGQVNPEKEYQMTFGDVTTGAIFKGKIFGKTVQGIWKNSKYNMKGTWKGQKVSP